MSAVRGKDVHGKSPSFGSYLTGSFPLAQMAPLYMRGAHPSRCPEPRRPLAETWTRGTNARAQARTEERGGRRCLPRRLKRVFSSYLLNSLQCHFLPQPLTWLNSVLPLISRSAWQKTAQSKSRWENWLLRDGVFVERKNLSWNLMPSSSFNSPWN